jgi:hypothetical protein
MDAVTAGELVKVLPKVSRRGGDVSRVTCQLVASHLVVSFNDPAKGASWSRDARGVEGQFPTYRKLVPAVDDSGRPGVSRISWNPVYMADASKLPHDRNVPMTWDFTDPHKSMLGHYPVTDAGIEWRYMLMPVRATS